MEDERQTFKFSVFEAVVVVEAKRRHKGLDANEV